MFMSIYTVQCEMKLARKGERLVEAEKARLARMLWSACESSQPQERSVVEKPAFKRMLTFLGFAGA